jgi:hypothetical protein
MKIERIFREKIGIKYDIRYTQEYSNSYRLIKKDVLTKIVINGITLKID